MTWNWWFSKKSGCVIRTCSSSPRAASVFFSFIFFADLSYVGFAPLGDFVNILGKSILVGIFGFKLIYFEAKINQFRDRPKVEPKFILSPLISRKSPSGTKFTYDKSAINFPINSHWRWTIIASKAVTVAVRLLSFRRWFWCQQISAVSNCSSPTVALEDVYRSQFNKCRRWVPFYW